MISEPNSGFSLAFSKMLNLILVVAISHKRINFLLPITTLPHVNLGGRGNLLSSLTTVVCQGSTFYFQNRYRN